MAFGSYSPLDFRTRQEDSRCRTYGPAISIQDREGARIPAQAVGFIPGQKAEPTRDQAAECTPALGEVFILVRAEVCIQDREAVSILVQVEVCTPALAVGCIKVRAEVFTQDQGVECIPGHAVCLIAVTFLHGINLFMS